MIITKTHHISIVVWTSIISAAAKVAVWNDDKLSVRVKSDVVDELAFVI